MILFPFRNAIHYMYGTNKGESGTFREAKV